MAQSRARSHVITTNDSAMMVVWMSGGRLSVDKVREAFETMAGGRKIHKDTMYMLAFRKP